MSDFAKDKDVLISRQAAIDSANEGLCDFFGLNADDFKFPITNTDYLAWALNKNITARINALPSAERKKGRFIGTEYDGYADGNPVYYEWKCSCCGAIFEDDEPTYNYCPNCGAKMEGGEDGRAQDVCQNDN